MSGLVRGSIGFEGGRAGRPVPRYGPSHAFARLTSPAVGMGAGLYVFGELPWGSASLPCQEKKKLPDAAESQGGEDSHLLRERLDGYNRCFHAAVAVPVDQTRVNEVETSLLARSASRSAETRGGHVLQMQTRHRD